eukprot:gnl/TRDRNA2_/TRDRNA2_176011_c0_seq16.p1 gnl/TRDRNA2_/TRDRNA2_176011_c0~~gnl/TRDRNA2_/TRDRNA2_176011_c0_seq16.p1  ORF type:complete len:688 (+),score=263.99 gnl/TRDRNA2_/TRDRNA2_176011_c0_seq16:68-2131(+)
MRSSVAVLVLLCLHAAAEEPAGPTPIQKVVKLLEEMRTTVNKEADEDKEAYDTYKCWCETNEKEKTEAISSAEALIEELTSFIEEAAGTEGRLKTEIAALAADIADDTDALETATAMKEKETAEFEADESYMKTTLAALKEAVSVLSEVQLLQKSHKAVDQTSALLQVRAVIEKAAPQFRGVMQRDLMDFLGAAKHLAPSKQAAFLDAKQPIEGGGAAAGAKSYNSRSGEIFGVLGAMEDQFKADLTAAQKEEMMAIIQFQKLKAAKTAEITAATTQKEQKEDELTDNNAKAAQAKEDLVATKSTLEADQAFMADLVKSCELADQEYAGRVKVRNQELLALAETLKIVTSDEARDLFGKTISFFQVDAANSLTNRLAAKARAQQKAMHAIVRTAAKHKNWAFAGLAVKVQLESSDAAVDKALDTMAARLQKQLAEETEKFEACKKQIDETEDNMKVNRREHDDLDETHKQLSNSIATLTDEIKALKKDVEDMEVALKQAGETRKTENLQFQQAVSDQRATIKILNMALDRLKEFYGFVQEGKTAAPPRPGGFSKNKSSGGVMQMIAKIISDAQLAESNYVMSEKDAQADYVAFVADATTNLEADRHAIAEKEALLAAAESEKSETDESHLANEDQRWKLKKLLVSKHRECDFMLKYFGARQQALNEEIDGVNDAIASLNGAVVQPAA